MALEPELPSEHVDDSELRSVRRKFWIALALTVPVVILAMAPHMLDLAISHSTAQLLRTIEMLLSVPVVLWAAADYYKRGWMGVVHRAPNMYTLIGLGVCIAFGYSLIATFLPHLFPPNSATDTAWSACTTKSRARSSLLVLLGEWLELRARGRTSAAIRQLLGLAPKTARRIEADGTEHDVPLGHVHAGDKLRVRPGEKIPVDGVVVEGQLQRRRVDADRRAHAGGEIRR